MNLGEGLFRDSFAIAPEIAAEKKQIPLTGEKANEVDRLKDALREQQFNVYAEMVALEMPFQEATQGFINDLNELFQDYYSSHRVGGFTQPQFFQIASLSEIRSFVAKSEYGQAQGSVAIVKECLYAADMDVNNYMKAKLLAHEGYHATAKTKWAMTSNGWQRERAGLQFANKTFSAKTGVLEEGKAMWFQEKIADPLIRKHFPAGAEKSDAAIANTRSMYADHFPLSIPSETLMIFGDETTDTVYELYPTSYSVVSLLEEQVPNFDTLSERARITGETIALAKAINHSFGRETFGRIARTPVGGKYERNEVQQLLEDLKK